MEDFSQFLEKENAVDEHLVEMIRDYIIIQETPMEDLNEMFEFGGDRLDEGIKDLIKRLGLIGHSAFDKSGMHVHKSKKGLLHYLASASKGVATIILAAIKGDSEMIKATMKTVKKEDVLDVLLKIDMAFLHIITGPIHTLDAITGWHLWANIENAAKQGSALINKIKDALEYVKKEIGNVVDRARAAKHQSYLSAIEAEL